MLVLDPLKSIQALQGVDVLKFAAGTGLCHYSANKLLSQASQIKGCKAMAKLEFCMLSSLLFILQCQHRNIWKLVRKVLLQAEKGSNRYLLLQCGDVVWLFACYNQIMESLNTDYDHRTEVSLAGLSSLHVLESLMEGKHERQALHSLKLMKSTVLSHSSMQMWEANKCRGPKPR